MIILHLFLAYIFLEVSCNDFNYKKESFILYTTYIYFNNYFGLQHFDKEGSRY